MIKTLIIDHEQNAMQGLASQLKRYASELDVVDTANCVNEGYEKIQTINPDLVFMDAEFRDGSGFDLLQKCRNNSFRVIITSDDANDAFNAFRADAIDYLLKPINRNALKKAIDQARWALMHGFDEETMHLELQPKNGTVLKKQKLAIKEAKAINYLDIDDIVYMKADGNYTQITLNTGRSYISSKVLKHYAGLLDDFGFMRIHRSSVINLNYVKEYRHKYGGCIILQNDEHFNISPDRKKAFFNRLGMI
jgi:two-component system LytT family response regulator